MDQNYLNNILIRLNVLQTVLIGQRHERQISCWPAVRCVK